MTTRHLGTVTGGRLNLRAAADTSAVVQVQIPDGTLLEVAEYNDTWFATCYGDKAGYVMKKYITSLSLGNAVELSGAVFGGALNLRRSASTAADRLIQIPNETPLVLINYDEADAWYITGYNGYTGYVMKQYVALNESPITAWQYGRVTSNTLNVRKAPSTSSACWNHVWPKDRIALIKTIPDTPGWYETLYRGEAAYVSGQHIAVLGEEVPGSIIARMLYMAIPELGRNQSIYFNGYTGAWCHRFADWLAMHAAMPKEMIPNTSNCGTGIVWFVNNVQSGGFYFKDAAHKIRMINAYPAIDHLSPQLSNEEEDYIPMPGDYIYFRWTNASASVNVSHVGIVREVAESHLTTFEGNSGNTVVSRTFELDDPQIVGYGRPRYGQV